MPFRFKQFYIDDLQCGMKVSTDSVILGAWAPLSHAQSILDIGTGSGLLALMSAQRSKANITAIELDTKAYQVAKMNVAESPWAKRIEVVQDDINHFASNHKVTFEHIICNPPYFLTGPQTQQQTRADARHTNTLTFKQLVIAIERLLAQDGQASLILPTEVCDAFFAIIKSSQLSIHTLKPIVPVVGKSQRRMLFTLSRSGENIIELPALILRDRQNRYTDEMISLTKDFYLKL